MCQKENITMKHEVVLHFFLARVVDDGNINKAPGSLESLPNHVAMIIYTPEV